MMATLLSIASVGMTYPARGGKPPFRALVDFNLEIDEDRPRIIAIAGESGSGKTTLGRLALGMIGATEGRLAYRGKTLPEMGRDERQRFRREVQAIFQDPFSVFNPFYKVDHLLHMPLRNFGIARDRDKAAELIADALGRVGLRPEQVLGRYPHQLSGGQRQRISVARSLMLRPKLIVADEPVSMIDASLRATILNRISALRDELGISIIYITHDLATARQVSDELYILYRGETVESGTAEAVITAPKHAYTKLLVGSIPRPDPDQPWTYDPDAERVA
jgi:ABC-type oligopeptide transport system ATPase subunit